MSRSSANVDNAVPDPDLERVLNGARGEPAAIDVSAMMSELEARIASAERQPGTWLKSRPTWVRRSAALGSAFALVLTVALTKLRPDFDDYPASRMVIVLASLGYLLAMSLYLCLRPLHRPQVPKPVTLALAATAIAVTFIVSAYPAPLGTSVPEHHGMYPCFYFGILIGLPVYAMARVLDRGAELSPLLAACAAGLLGNLVLQLNCPNSVPSHLLANHFPVLVVFVIGLGAIRWFTPRRRPSD